MSGSSALERGAAATAGAPDRVSSKGSDELLPLKWTGTLPPATAPGREIQIYLSSAFDVQFGSAVTTLLRGLSRERDFLGYQLDHALGNIPDEEYEEIAAEFLAYKETRSKEDTTRLLTTIGRHVDLSEFGAEFFATALDCSLHVILEIFEELSRA